MKKQFGENMNSERKTKIEDEIIEDEICDELQDEIFDTLKDLVILESRLLKRFYDFCLEFNSFEYDEMGENIEEADAVLERANKIRDKLLNNIFETTSYQFSNVKTDEVYYKILLDIIIEEETRHCIIEVDEDSFDLEVY